MKTRFAPSPTGYLHVGGARTAIFNWLLARRHGGAFIVRIEDTDLKRNTPTAAQQVLADLRWLGLDWDEGPDVGGPNGPYYQSQRLEIYHHYAQKLLDAGKAYYCFDTPEQLQAQRQQAETAKQPATYRRPERFPDAKEVAKARAEGKPVSIRFAVDTDQPIIVDDLVRGQVVFEPNQIGDFVIIKSDGFPTYHFAVVVDDELMGITHVLRGQEHLMNTPNHQLLQKALGFRIPQYAHMSVTVSESGGKLSKRERPNTLRQALLKLPHPDWDKIAAAGGLSRDQLQAFLDGHFVPDMPIVDAIAAYVGVHLPEINVVDFFKSGYLPETMLNFLALLGWNPGDGREIMSRDELIAAFDLARVSKSNSLFDRNKLLAFNTEYLKRLPVETIRRHLRAYAAAVQSPLANADDATLDAVIQMNHGARTLEQIDQKSRFAFIADDAYDYDAEAVEKVLRAHEGLAILRQIAQALRSQPPKTPADVEALLRGIAAQRGVGLAKVAQPLRVAITGTTISPSMFEAVILLGIPRTLKRIERTLNLYDKPH